MAVAGADDALNACEVSGSQSTVRFEGGVHPAFVAGHSALQTNRERVDAVHGIIRDACDEAGRVGLGIEVRLAAVLEDGVDHAHVHQQALRRRTALSDFAVDVPLAIHQADTRAIEVSSRRCRRTEPCNQGCHHHHRCKRTCHMNPLSKRCCRQPDSFSPRCEAASRSYHGSDAGRVIRSLLAMFIDSGASSSQVFR